MSATPAASPIPLSPHWQIVRGALSIGIAMMALPYLVASPTPNWIAMFGLFCLAGVGFQIGNGRTIRVALGFGVGAVLAIAVIAYGMERVTQAYPARPSLWVVFVSTVGWSSAGALSGAAIRFRMLIPGMAAFAIGGAIFGAVLYSVTEFFASVAMWGVALGWAFAGTIAGGLFGAFVAVASRRSDTDAVQP